MFAKKGERHFMLLDVYQVSVIQSQKQGIKRRVKKNKHLFCITFLHKLAFFLAGDSDPPTDVHSGCRFLQILTLWKETELAHSFPWCFFLLLLFLFVLSQFLQEWSRSKKIDAVLPFKILDSWTPNSKSSCLTVAASSPNGFSLLRSQVWISLESTAVKTFEKFSLYCDLLMFVVTRSFFQIILHWRGTKGGGCCPLAVCCWRTEMHDV